MFLRAWMLLCAIAVAVSPAEAQAEKPRARDRGVPFEGTPGPLNAITDVAGVEVGHTTLVSGDAVRTGVTVLLPAGRRGRHQAEAWDGGLNDINGFHGRPEHVFAAIESARGGAVTEGNVGGGTGMTAHQFKGGIGTSSRLVETDQGRFTVGALVQANYGFRSELRIAGVPSGRGIKAPMPEPGRPAEGNGALIVAAAPDAPVLPHQLKRIAKRASLGLGRNGSIASNGSGDIFIAFSTFHKNIGTEQGGLYDLKMLGNSDLNPIFRAPAEAWEKAVINAMVAAETMTGRNGTKVYAIPHDRLREALRQVN